MEDLPIDLLILNKLKDIFEIQVATKKTKRKIKMHVI